jgi:2-haloacid dehalogenase
MTIKAFVFDAYGTLYDVQSVAAVTDAAFPGHGAYITQVWRLKQLEYTWLRSLMGRYEDFLTVTRESLAYTLGTLGLSADEALFDRIVAAYDNLSPYPDALEALNALAGYRLAILSNGSPAMLDALVGNTGLDRHLEAVISVDAKRVFKPDRGAYELVEERLGIRPDEVMFVSSNGFDVSGAKSFGFRVARIERVSAAAMQQELTRGEPIGPAALFRALRMRTESFGYEPDVVVTSLRQLPDVISA